MTTVWKIVVVFVAICICTAAGQCSDNCLSDPANATAPACNETTEECGFGCAQGFAGPLCNYTCVASCQNCTLNSTADPPSTVCELCDDDFYLQSDGTCANCSTECTKNDTSDMRTCADETGQCNLGCLDGFYGMLCDMPCSDSCFHKCDQMTGECGFGCAQGYTGPLCNYPCVLNCQNCTLNSTADPPSTVCELCDDDFYLQSDGTCAQCTGRCATNDTSDIRTCADETGQCNLGCIDGFHGTLCDIPCPASCFQDKCEQMTGKCGVGCDKGFAGPLCNYTCVLRCKNCILDSTADPPSPVCEMCDDNFYMKSDGTCALCSSRCARNATSDIRTCADKTAQCNLGCIDGFHGPTCNRACTASCYQYKCDQMTAACDHGCGQRTRCGQTCSNRCKTGCSMEACNQDCVCDGGCKPEFYGEICSDMCSDACMSCNNTERRCTNDTGDCICGCTDVSKHGPHCDKTCPENCVDSECDQSTGNCAKGCVDGYYREQCDVICSVNCLHNECDQLTGNCAKGCVDGYYRDKCDVICSVNCLHKACDVQSGICEHGCTNKWYGEFCTLTCGKNCVNGTCHRDNGKCAQGCAEGFSGDFCDQVIQEQTVVILAIAGACAVAFGILVTIAVVVRRRTVKKKVEKERIRQSQLILMNPDGILPDETPIRRTRTTGHGIRKSVVSMLEVFNPMTLLKKHGNQPKSHLRLVAMKEETRIRIDDLLNLVTNMDNSDFNEEFELLPKGFGNKSHAASRLPASLTKNCYKDIYPYDESRVVLEPSTGDMVDAADDDTVSDYINASWITGINGERRYIAAQGPTKTTTADFWQMIWQENSLCIVMLSMIGDSVSSNCETYWPLLENTNRYGDIQITTMAESTYADYKVRKLLAIKNEETRDIQQLSFTPWPERGIPGSAGSMLDFYDKYRAVVSRDQADTGPIVVHCTAGVGRTGFFIGLDLLATEALNTGAVNVLKCIKRLREQRVNMVQSASQYEFLYKVLAHISLLEPYHEKFSDTFAAMLNDIRGTTPLARTFETIKDSVALDESDIESIMQNNSMGEKNRDGADIPQDAYRPVLPGDGYINAVYVDTHVQRGGFIVTQAPTCDTVEDLYRLVCHERCSVIVMLNPFDPKDDTQAVYWPTQSSLSHGDVEVTAVDTHTSAHSVVRKLIFTDLAQGDKDELHVTMYQFTDWSADHETPVNDTSLVDLALEVQELHSAQKDDTILVHCLKGSERSGLFCVLYTVLEAILTGERFSIAATVRKIKTIRPSAIPSQEQFQYCYEAVKHLYGSGGKCNGRSEKGRRTIRFTDDD